MKRAPQAPSPPATAAGGEILQLKVWLMDISPMVWRRLLVPVNCTLHELGVASRRNVTRLLVVVPLFFFAFSI